MLTSLLLASAMLALPVTAHTIDQSDCLTTPLFLDTFEAEPNGGSKTTLIHWTVLSGNTDIVGDGTTWPSIQPGEGKQLDLDGSNAGVHIATKASSLGTAPAGKYLLRFELGGNDRGRPADTVEVRLTNTDTNTEILAVDFVDIPSTEPMTFHTFGFNLPVDTNIQVSFHDVGADSFGAILDDVMVCPTAETYAPLPELSSGLLGLVGMGLLGAIAVGWNGVLRRR